MKHCLGGIPRHLPKQLADTLRLGREGNVLGERRVKVDHVECLQARRILDEMRRSRDGINEPRLASHVPCVQHGLSLAFEYFKLLTNREENCHLDANCLRNMTAPGQWLASKSVTWI